MLANGPLDTWDTVVIAVLALTPFGAKKLPTFVRSLRESMAEFDKAREDFGPGIAWVWMGAVAFWAAWSACVGWLWFR
jgi:hypothetical protein